MTTKAETPRFLAVDFYCGAGGTTRGLQDAGGYVIVGIDKDDACQDTYQCNNLNITLDGKKPAYLSFDMLPASQDYLDGQQQSVWDELNTLIPRYRKMAPGIPLLFAICAPCQSFTKFIQRQLTADRVAGRERERSLLAQTIGFIEKFQPEMVISENVSGIERGQNQQVWADFRKDLEEKYRTGHDRVCASHFGVPQYRRRSILMGIRRGKEDSAAFDITIPTLDPEAPSNPSVQDFIGRLPALDAGGRDAEISNHVCRNLTDINRQRLQSVKPGEPNWKLSETEFGDLTLPCHRRLASKGKRGFGDVYTRMRPDRPSPTITTRFHSISNGRFGHYDQQQVRGLSLREGATLQSFPEDYVFYGNGMDSIARMIGNAVPPKLSEYMARSLYEVWQGAAGGTAGTSPDQRESQSSAGTESER